MKKKFRNGDRVRASMRHCATMNSSYRCVGTITGSVIERYDPEVHMRGWRVGPDEGRRIRMYTVAFGCPKCGALESARYPGAILRPVVAAAAR